MSKKTWSFIIVILNIIGVLCLIYYAIPYFLHDVNVVRPDAMIPFKKWEASGWILTLGLLPLMTVNILAMLFVGNKKLKLIVRTLFLIPCIVCFGIVGHYWFSELSTASANEVTSSSVPVVSVKVKSNETSETQYVLLYDDGGMEKLDNAFEVDDVEMFTADVNNFTTEVKNNKVVNSLVSTTVIDNSGNEVEADTEVIGLLNTLSDTVDHEIIQAKIIKDGQKYFVAVQTNVNLQSPCVFYEFDQNEGTLEELCTWDDVEIVGVRNYN